MCVCVCILISIKFYHKTLPQFRTNYSFFQNLTLIKRKKHNIKNRKFNYSLYTKETNNTNKLMQINYYSTLTKIKKLQQKKKGFFPLLSNTLSTDR